MSKNRLDRRRSAVTAPKVLALAAVSVGIVIALGAAAASGASRTGAMPAAQGAMQRVVVLLRGTSATTSSRAAVRTSAIRAQVTPLVESLRSAGATHITTGKAIPYFSASVSAAQQAALAANPAVKAVFPNEKIHLGAPLSSKQLDAAQAPAASHVPSGNATNGSSIRTAGQFSICGTAAKPEQDPEALSVINAQAPSYDGAGVKVAYIAGHINTTISDFQRNSKYVGPGSPSGPVVSEQNFNGDAAGDDGGDLEAFLDMSSIAAQGNVIHDLSQFVNPAHPLPAGCDLTITGDAPGATVTGLNVFSSDYNTTTSYFVQAIDWAVANNINVINESFGSNPFPDNANDAVRLADDAAVAAGVTVVVSSGDSGVTNTQGSPSDDPKMIAAGASTTFRSYEQYKSGVINATMPKATNGTWLDNNISSISSGGYSQSGGTVNLVAPGDLNWIACDTATCGGTQQMFQEGGTSESSPLTAGAAADVISAYRATHKGASPTPALVKQILVSTASDIVAPAEQQGAGILNVGAAINLATTINHGSKPSSKNEISFSTNQINIQGNANSNVSQKVGITNNGKTSVTVKLSTRTLSKQVSATTGTACLNPTNATIACGPPTTTTLVRETGGTQVYVEKQFTVPNAGKNSRLNFSAAIPAQSTNFSPMRVALYAPNGAYAGYSIPQGIGNYANVQVASPQPGKWTAVFADAQNNSAQQGTITWEADTWKFTAGGTVSPASLTIAPGHTKSAVYKVKLPATPGDTSQSILVKASGSTGTIPVTIRTLATPGATFDGVLTGGNGRGNPAEQSTYAFKVPAGKTDIDVAVAFADINDGVVAFLQDPSGNNVAQSSNLYNGSSLSNTVNVYKDHPVAGTWTLVLDWLPPVSGSAVSTPFVGEVNFNQVVTSNNLPTSSTTLTQGQPATFTVHYKNTSPAPQLIFLDPRQSTSAWVDLADLNGDPNNVTLPQSGFSYPIYSVPQDSTKLFASLLGTVPVSFDFDPWTGDPDLYASGGMNPTYTYAPSGGDVTSGFWGIFPSEVGPFGPTGAPSATAQVDLQAWMPQFDSTVSTDTGDLWSYYNGYSGSYSPIEVDPGVTASINLSITPTAAVGTTVSGVIHVDDDYLFSPFIGPDAGGDQLASLPYSYKVGS